MLSYFKDKTPGNVDKYIIAVDAKKEMNSKGMITDSFDSLAGVDGLFTQIATMANISNRPAYITFFFVKDARETLKDNGFFLTESNTIKQLSLPILPVSSELEKTLRNFFEEFYNNFKIASNYVDNLNLTKESASYLRNDINYIKNMTLDYIFKPSDNLKSEVIDFMNKFSANLPKNDVAENIFKIVDETTDLSAELVKALQLYSNRKRIKEYFATIDYINRTPNNLPNNLREKLISQDILKQSEGLVLYIRNHLSKSHQVANEMLNEYANLIEGLSIFKDSDPIKINLSSEESSDKYIRNVIDITLNVLLSYREIPANSIVNNKIESDGKCIRSTNPIIAQNYEIESNRRLEEMLKEFKNMKDSPGDNNGNGLNF